MPKNLIFFFSGTTESGFSNANCVSEIEKAAVDIYYVQTTLLPIHVQYKLDLRLKRRTYVQV